MFSQLAGLVLGVTEVINNVVKSCLEFLMRTGGLTYKLRCRGCGGEVGNGGGVPRRPARPAFRDGRSRLTETKPAIESAAEPQDDAQLARLLVRMWVLASGRTVRVDVPPDQLTEDELMLFWADDFSVSGGRHAASE